MVTKYPNQVDTNDEIPLSTDNITKVDAIVVNNLRGAILAIEAELSINPSREYGSVRDRLDALQQQITSGSGGGGGGGGVVITNTPPSNVDKSAAAVGILVTAARSDHKHNINTATATSIGSTNTEGSAVNLARSDHTHAVTDLNITSQTQGSILYFNGSNWVRLSPSTDGDVLTTHGAGNNPSWTTVSSSGTGQIIVSSCAALSSYSLAVWDEGTIAQVAGFDTYKLIVNAPSGAYSNADGVNVIQAGGSGSPYQSIWARQFTILASNEYITDIYVDASSGHDYNDGSGPGGAPLKTLREAFTRISRLGLITQDITIHYSGNVHESIDIDLTGLVAYGTTNTINLVGTLTIANSQSITSFSAADPSSNTRGLVTFPASGYAVGEALYFTGGSSGSAMSWVHDLGTSSQDYVPGFFAKDGTNDNPSGGNTVSHVTFDSTIASVTVKLPVGYRLNILNLTIEGVINNQGSDNAVLVNQCNITAIDVGTGKVYFRNCTIISIGASVNFGQPNSLNGRAYENCVLTNGAFIENSMNFSFIGRITSHGNITLVNSNVRCVGGPGFQYDISIWGLSSISAAINLKRMSTLDLSYFIIWGNNSGVNYSLSLDGPNCWVLYDSNNLPTITGGGSNWNIVSNRGSWANLPAVCSEVPAGIIRSDTAAGTAGANLNLLLQSANISVTNIFASTPRKGLYRISGYIQVTTAGTSGTPTLNATWTDASGVSQTKAICTLSGVTLAAGSGGVIEVWLPGSANMQYSVTGIVTAGSLKYSISLTAKLDLAL